MATVAPKQPIELDLNGSGWQNLTNGSTVFDGIDVTLSSNGNVQLEKHSSAIPNTKGLVMNPQNVYIFTKVAGYDVWVNGTGWVRLESAK